jgi:hypothetical protein
VLGAAWAQPLAWRPGIEIAVGGGERGRWQQNESRYDYVDDPAVALTEGGAALIAWVDQRSKDVFFKRLSRDGEALGPALNISRSPETFSWLPRITLAPGEPGAIFILWQEIIFSGGSHGGDILFARSQDGGATFSAPLNLSNSVGGDGKGRINKDVWHNGSLDVAAGPDGSVYAAWTEYDGPLWLSRSRDSGRTFSPASRIAGDRARPARAPSLALAPNGVVHLAWTVGEDASADIRIASSTDGGASFGEPCAVARTPGYSDAPKLAVDAGGVLHLVFAESARGPFDAYHLRYARSRDGGRTFEAPRQVSPAGAAFPALTVDAHGTVYMVWELFRSPGERPRGLGMVLSRDGGHRFSAPSIVPGSADPGGGSNGSHQGLLMQKLAVNRRGELAIVNSSLKEDRGSRVWLLRAAPAYP